MRTTTRRGLPLRPAVIALACWTACAVPSAAPAAVRVEIDAAKLKPGDLPSLSAGGAAAPVLSAGGGRSIEAGTVDGRRAVTFTGGDWLTSTFPAPDALTGRSAFTVAVWAYNPAVGGEEAMVQWARRGATSRAAQFNYGSNGASGALVHWGSDDMGYEGGVPAAGAWHHLAVTYTGGADGTESVYVNGRVVATERKSLDLWPGDPIHIGHALEAQGFTGSLASVQMYGAALSAADVAALAEGRPVTAKPLVDLAAAGLAEGPLLEWANAGTAGGRFKRASIPRVEEVAGRRAIVFDGSQYLVGEAPLAGLTAEGPFTLEAWVYNPSLGNAETYAALTARDAWPVEFNFSRNLMDGALAAGRTAVPFSARPAPGAWHHLAVTYSGGREGTLAVYVDGEQDSTQTAPVAVPPEARFVLGGGGRRGFSGALASLRLHDTALTPYELRQGCGMVSAFNPAPRSGTTVEALSAALTWDRGTEGVAGYAVYFGKDKLEVERRAKTALAAARVPADQPRHGPVPLNVGATYYWRVDQLDAQGSNAWPGIVWTFTVDPGAAQEPEPRDRTANTPAATTTELAWTPGRFATKQHVFFGTDEAAVAAATEPAAANLAGTAGRCPVPAPLRPGTRYFWRVDSENGAQPPTKGPVWAFRTQDARATNDVTFFVISDTHYTPEPASYLGVRETIDAMNWLPGTAYPPDIGGTVQTPRGVLHTGDMLDSGGSPSAAAVWAIFTADFGVNGEGRVCYPVYEIVGNHDAGDGSPPQEGVRLRNRQRQGLSGVSTNGLHYSWTWDHLHLVAVNKFSGSTRDPSRPYNQQWNDPTGSLEFLRDDLRRNGADRPVIVLQHYGFEGFSAAWGWWSEKDRVATWEAIRDYNVIAYLHGHTHLMTFFKWKGEDFHLEGQKMPEDGVDIIGCASGQRGPGVPGEFMVFRVTDKEMIVAHRFADRWGEVRRFPIPAKPRFARPAVEAP